ncbi:signaling peptide TAXIMIN 2-like [Cucumis melo]|uniref:Signaling peptide TAXIMIN 2-like n=1 Tax=Cucumis melo TaxID=3656 RepID=A0A1S3C2P5_CUCME|nr:signaling peptide TAXIMIN 2-like [Cucumis melo]
MACCRPLGFLIGLPFSFLSLVLSFIGALLWIFWSLLSCICPCCVCFAVLSDFSISLMKLPINVMDWFIDLIPC